MSHEIRTPLNGVLGMAHLAKMSCAEPRAREYLDMVEESGRSLLAIINDILDLARIESGGVALENKPFHIRRALESALAPLSVMAGAKGLDFGLTVDSYNFV